MFGLFTFGLFTQKVSITVSNIELTFMYRQQKLERVLTTGEYEFNDGKGDKAELDFETHDVSQIFYAPKNVARFYRQNPMLAEHIEHLKLDPTQVGVLYLNDRVHGIVAPGEHLYLFKAAGEFQLKRINIAANIEVDKTLMTLIEGSDANSTSRLIRSRRTKAVTPICKLVVEPNTIGLLYIDRQLTKRLEPGQHYYWQFNNVITMKSFDCRTQILEVSGQEILSKDKVSLRINLNASIKVVDAELAAQSVETVNDYAYKMLQLALREAVGTKTLDDLLIDKLYVNETMQELVKPTLEKVGVELHSVGVKDIILPGDMKSILNRVVEAQKEAEANVIKRREETAATRSLNNTAKVMENNPTLMRLKELEALEKMAEKIDQLTVYGGMEGLSNMVKLA